MSESHNDIELLIEDLLEVTAVLDGIEACILETDSGYDVFAQAHGAAILAEHEADDMLDAALDVVFEETFDAVPVSDAYIQTDTHLMCANQAQMMREFQAAASGRLFGWLN